MSIAIKPPSLRKGIISALPLIAIGAVSLGLAVNYDAHKTDVPANTQTMTYIVQPGDRALWTIAAAHDHRDDTRAVVGWIERTNHITADIHVGESFVIPVD